MEDQGKNVVYFGTSGSTLQICENVSMFGLILFQFSIRHDASRADSDPHFSNTKKKIIQTMICPHVHCSVNKQETYQSKFLIQNSVFFLLFQAV